MTLYAVILHRPSDTVFDSISKNWPDRYFIADKRLALISSDKNDLTAHIAERVGIGVEFNASGLVIQMDYYAGTGSSPLVEWINKNT